MPMFYKKKKKFLFEFIKNKYSPIQFWPAAWKADLIKVDSKKPKSVDFKIIAGSLPPNSIQQGFKCLEAANATFFPTISDPINVIWSMSGDAVNSSTVSG